MVVKKLFDFCPDCGCGDLVVDEVRCELYCGCCGVVLSMPYGFVGGVGVDCDWSYDYGDVVGGREYPRWFNKSIDTNDIAPSRIIEYTHDIPDDTLMRKGYKGRLRMENSKPYLKGIKWMCRG